MADDPLTGGPAPPPAVQATVAAPAGTPVPPLPVATSATSTASLAGGKPLPGGRDLSIEEPRDRLVKNTWDGPAKLANRRAGGATLQPPEPIITPVARITPDPAKGVTVFDGTNSGAKKSEATYEQLQAQLVAHGMNWYRQEKWGDGVKFSCTLPVKDDPTRTLNYVAVAGNGVEALKAVLEQIEKGP